MLLVSTELDEVLALSDRIAVMFDGRVVAVLDRDETDATELGLYMAGSSPDEHHGDAPSSATEAIVS